MIKKIIIMLLMYCFFYQMNAQCHCCGSSPVSFSSGESSFSAVSNERNKLSIETFADYRQFKGLSYPSVTKGELLNNAGMEVSNLTMGSIGIRYGISNRLSVFIQEPYFIIKSSSFNSKTTGDMTSLLNYTVIKKQNRLIGVQAGVEWPTGRQVLLNHPGSSLTTGSGSYDPLAGLSFVRSSDRSTARGSVFFKYTTKGFNDVRYGNFFGQQFSYMRYVIKPNNTCSPDSLAGHSDFFLGLIILSSGEWTQQQMKNNVYIDNTGSYCVFAGSAISAGVRGYSFSAQFTFPVYQKYHGSQNIAAFRIRLGIIKTFN